MLSRRAGAALGMAGVVTAGAVWLGAGGASAGSGNQELGWPGRPVTSMAEVQRMSAAAARGDDSTLIVVTRAVRGAGVDVGAKGESPGDFFVFEEKVFDNTRTEKIGRDAVRCEAGLRTFTCEATIRINGRGKIRVAGTLFRPTDNIVPVTGGTQNFRGVGGSLTVYDLRNGNAALVFDLVKP